MIVRASRLFDVHTITKMYRFVQGALLVEGFDKVIINMRPQMKIRMGQMANTLGSGPQAYVFPASALAKCLPTEVWVWFGPRAQPRGRPNASCVRFGFSQTWQVGLLHFLKP